MFRVVLTSDLKAMIGQVDEVVLVGQVKSARTGAQIALSVEVDLEIFGDDDPDPNIKLASIQEQGPLDILLDYPVFDLNVLIKHVILYIFHALKDAYPSTTIQKGWFNKPHVFLTVLGRHSFACKSA